MLFECFTNPANNKYAWNDVESKEIIVLQDYAYNPERIAGKSFLLLLEGLPAPKNHFEEDICLDLKGRTVSCCLYLP